MSGEAPAELSYYFKEKVGDLGGNVGIKLRKMVLGFVVIYLVGFVYENSISQGGKSLINLAEV